MRTHITPCWGTMDRAALTWCSAVLVAGVICHGNPVQGRIPHLDRYDARLADPRADTLHTIDPDPFNHLPIVLFLSHQPRVTAEPVPAKTEPVKQPPAVPAWNRPSLPEDPVPHHRRPTPSSVPRRRLSPIQPQPDERKPEFRLERSR